MAATAQPTYFNQGGTSGNLRYTIHPIQGAVEAFYERQFQQMEEYAARQRAEKQLEKSNAQGRENALCASFREEASPSSDQGVETRFEPFSAGFYGTITGLPPKPSEASSVGEGGAA